MPKPSLLYASPFPPQRSGISECSAALVRALSGFFRVTLYTDNYEIDDPNQMVGKVSYLPGLRRTP